MAYEDHASVLCHSKEKLYGLSFADGQAAVRAVKNQCNALVVHENPGRGKQVPDVLRVLWVAAVGIPEGDEEW
jgi:hypothetical protein